MAYYLVTIFGAAILTLTYYILRILSARISYTQALRKYNCSRPHAYPHTSPLLGRDLNALITRGMTDGNLMALLRKIHNQCGDTFQATNNFTTVLYTIDPLNIQTVCALEFEKFGVEPLRKPISKVWMGMGVFTTDGALWEHARKTLKPIFRRGKMGDLEGLGRHVDRLMKLVPRDGGMVDLQPLFARLFLDSSTEYLFGDCLDSLVSDSRSREAEGFIEGFDNLEYFRDDGSFDRNVSESHQRIEKYIDTALERRKKATNGAVQDESTVPSPSFVDQLVEYSQDRILRDQLLNIFFPARDSSAIGASCVFFLLARNPRVWQKLREEVGKFDQPITFESLKSITYLRWVLNECLRLLAPANRAVRTCLQDCILPRGGGPNGTEPIYVQKGVQIDMNFGLMQQDPAIWGEDAEEFRPEKWENLKPTWEFMPFLAGPRICPAQQLVLTQYGYLLVRFVREFERMDNRDEVIEFVEEYRMTKQSRNGVKVAFVPARE